jgi:hypothetical protein
MKYLYLFVPGRSPQICWTPDRDHGIDKMVNIHQRSSKLSATLQTVSSLDLCSQSVFVAAIRPEQVYPYLCHSPLRLLPVAFTALSHSGYRGDTPAMAPVQKHIYKSKDLCRTDEPPGSRDTRTRPSYSPHNTIQIHNANEHDILPRFHHLSNHSSRIRRGS